MLDWSHTFHCQRCSNAGGRVRFIRDFERVMHVTTPGDPNYGLWSLDTVYIVECQACGLEQEHLQRRWPFATRAEAERELEAWELGKG